MNDALQRLADASKFAESTINQDNVSVHMSIETAGIRVGVYYDVDGRTADAGRLVAYDDISEADINPLITALEAAMTFVGAAP
jgi:hypothetical protein